MLFLNKQAQCFHTPVTSNYLIETANQCLAPSTISFTLFLNKKPSTDLLRDYLYDLFSCTNAEKQENLRLI